MAHKISSLQPLILAARPCAAGNAEYFSVSLSRLNRFGWCRSGSGRAAAEHRVRTDACPPAPSRCSGQGSRVLAARAVARPRLTGARSWNGCAATSAARRCAVCASGRHLQRPPEQAARLNDLPAGARSLRQEPGGAVARRRALHEAASFQPLNTAASAQNACMPRSVSGWSATPARMAAGTVRMSAPASSISDTCAGLRMLAASTSVRMS